MLQVKVELQMHALGNGLRVILAPRRDLPVVSVTVMYEVGSVDEEPGRTGFAHLFEHLMFQGSAHVPRNGHFKMVESAGGVLNAFTTRERTAYYEALPSHRLALGLWLESDRMRSLAITQENFDTERSTVKEERRQSYDNRAYGHAYETLDAMAYDDPCYAHSVIGSMEDLDRATLEDVKSFWDRFYAPTNATLVLVGDFDAAEAMALVRHYFQDIPTRPRSRPRIPALSARPGREARSGHLADAHAELPALFLAFTSPESLTRPWYATRLLRQILTHGDSSRLHQRLVRELRIATHVGSHMEQLRGPAPLVFVSMGGRGDLGHTRDVIVEELSRVARDGVPDAELEKARHKVVKGYLDGLQGSIGRGVQIATACVLTGRPDAINTEVGRYLELTGEDLRQAAAWLCDAAPRTWLEVQPRGAAA